MDPKEVIGKYVASPLRAKGDEREVLHETPEKAIPWSSMYTGQVYPPDQKFVVYKVVAVVTRGDPPLSVVEGKLHD